MDYSSYYNWHMNPYRQYKPVTAYTLSTPVNVNGVNINVPPYQALNYKPKEAQYEYVYVPIAQFSKVGAQVIWDEPTQTLNVTTDYFALKQSQQASFPLQSKVDICHDALAALRFAYKEVASNVPVTEDTKGKLRFNGAIGENKVVFDGQWWAGSATNLTVGKYYTPDYDNTAGTQYLLITNDIGQQIYFSRVNVELSVEHGL